jgi:NAD(P) transhydrogenase subunit alpha
MTATLLANVTIFVLSLLIGFEVLSKIPTTLHTPMMSGANAIHGVVLAGAVTIAVLANTPLTFALTVVAGALAAANVVGGYVLTDRMLKMFTRPTAAKSTIETTK